MNEELRQREEETVRQSEELQSQPEELERQGEELRFTNEEIANRERMLEQLLELSRALTGELEPEAVHARICETLGLIIEDASSAMLERQRDAIVVRCCHRFGPDGPERSHLPYQHSFASLVLAAGQTAYLEDTELRPDLAIPRPRTGPRFRAVLSTPLRAHGKSIGTLETYTTTPYKWTDMHVALLESLAAQASVSLQNADLFEAIRHERRRFESAVRTAPFGLCVCDDPSGTELRFNPAAATMFGMPSGVPVALASPAGARFLRSVHRVDDPLDGPVAPHVQALGGAELRNEELEARLPDGRTVTLLVSASPIYDGKGAISGAVCAFIDITPQKALQRELELRRREAEDAAQRKTRFLAAVSHDIRTPANAINLMAELIKRSASVPALFDDIPNLADRLKANALSLVELVSDVLDLARYDAGRADIQETEFSLAEMIASEVRQIEPLAEDKGLCLTTEPVDPGIWLRTDAVKLGRILGNLLGNAIKFTEHGKVRVAAGLTRDREAWLRVSDTGVGIPPQDLERIFDEFAQLRNPARDSRRGMGLGLAICHRLVQLLGASIRVESTLGNGSTFTVIFPPESVVPHLEIARTHSPRESALGDASLAGLRILLVEDHEATREGTARLLAAAGALVTEAGDGTEALSSLERNATDVLLLDMMLPDVDGREILAWLRDHRPSALRAVLVLTGDLTQERRLEVQRLGADGLLPKPVAIPHLFEALAIVRRPLAN